MKVQGVAGAGSSVLQKKQQGNEEYLLKSFDAKQALQEDAGKIKDQLKEAVKEVNNFLKPMKTSIQFVLHEELGEYYVKVVNEDTKEVIREIPPKKMLDMYAAMAELIGLLVDRKI